MVPVSPLWGYLQNFTMVIILAVVAGIVVLVVYPKHGNKVASVWVAIGLFQVVFSSFYTYSPGVSDGFLNGLFYLIFPNEAVVGLFILTFGVIVATFGFHRKTNPGNIFRLSLLFLGLLELVPFIDFSFKFPDLSAGNIWVNATPYIAFLAAAIATTSCGLLAHSKSFKYIRSTAVAIRETLEPPFKKNARSRVTAKP